MTLAVTAVVRPEGFMLGVTEEGMGGYVPLYSHGTFESYKAAQEAADKENERLGLSKEQAIRIVLESFGGLSI